jgi:hypothetical protein
VGEQAFLRLFEVMLQVLLGQFAVAVADRVEDGGVLARHCGMTGGPVGLVLAHGEVDLAHDQLVHPAESAASDRRDQGGVEGDVGFDLILEGAFPGSSFNRGLRVQRLLRDCLTAGQDADSSAFEGASAEEEVADLVMVQPWNHGSLVRRPSEQADRGQPLQTCLRGGACHVVFARDALLGQLLSGGDLTIDDAFAQRLVKGIGEGGRSESEAGLRVHGSIVPQPRRRIPRLSDTFTSLTPFVPG